MRLFIVVLLIVAAGFAQEDSLNAKLECAVPKEPAEPADEFDCGFQGEFPLEEYEKALSADPKVKEIVTSYDDVAVTEKTAAVCPSKEYVATEEDAAADKALVSYTRWIDLCPTWQYTIWRWGIYIRPYGRCFVLTSVRATRCQRPNRPCRYISPFFWTRCRQQYRRVNILAFCPSAPQYFVWKSTWVPSGCNCQRLVCGFLTAQTIGSD